MRYCFLEGISRDATGGNGSNLVDGRHAVDEKYSHYYEHDEGITDHAEEFHRVADIVHPLSSKKQSKHSPKTSLNFSALKSQRTFLLATQYL